MYSFSVMTIIIVSYSVILTGKVINDRVEPDVFWKAAPSNDRLTKSESHDTQLSHPSSYGQNTTFGNREYGDRLDYNITIKKHFMPWWVVTEDVYYPQPGHYSLKITCIQVIDCRTDKNGGSASITSGGVGNRNVTVHLKSKRNYGFCFTVNIYGKW